MAKSKTTVSKSKNLEQAQTDLLRIAEARYQMVQECIRKPTQRRKKAQT